MSVSLISVTSLDMWSLYNFNKNCVSTTGSLFNYYYNRNEDLEAVMSNDDIIFIDSEGKQGKNIPLELKCVQVFHNISK